MVCNDCGHIEISYNSCRNRNCPQCQTAAQEKWIAAQTKRLLRTHYFQVVFTPAPELKPLFLCNPELYGLLMSTSAATLQRFGRETLGAQLGITSVLHTWKRDMGHHPHVHSLVAGGGLSLDGNRWVAARRDFLFPVRAMSDVFRAKFLKSLHKLFRDGKLTFTGPASEFAQPEGFSTLLDTLRKRSWLVYCAPTIASPTNVLRYLGRYTYRLAISDHRLVNVTRDAVTFRTRGKDTVTVDPATFIKRYLLHVLPSGFRRIRHYGIFANSNLRTKWQKAADIIGVPNPPDEAKNEPSSPPECANCHSTNVVNEIIDPEPPRNPGHPGTRAPPHRAGDTT